MFQASFVVNAYVHGVRSRILQEAVDFKIRRKLTERRLSNVGFNHHHRASIKSCGTMRRSHSAPKIPASSEVADDVFAVNCPNGITTNETPTNQQRRPSLFRNNTIASFDLNNVSGLEDLKMVSNGPTSNGTGLTHLPSRVSFVFTSKDVIIETSELSS